MNTLPPSPSVANAGLGWLDGIVVPPIALKPYYKDDYATLYHGDARDILPKLEWAVMLTDPPYGISHSSGWEGPYKDKPIEGDGDASLRDWALQVNAGKPAAVFGTWRIGKPKNIRAVLIWDKGPASGMGDLALPWKPSWEEIYIIGDGWSGRRDEGVMKGHTVVTWASKGRSHPNQKPLTLLTALICKAPAGTICDPFAGSGTTLVAAKELRRLSIGIECDEQHAETAAKRLSQEVLPL